MAEPLSLAGVVLQLGSILKELYEYGKRVKGAQSHILSLCSELAALKSILTDLQTQHESGTPGLREPEFSKMLSMATTLLDGLSYRLGPKISVRQRAMQSLKFPLEGDALKETLSRLERIKSWFLLILMSDEYATSKSLQADLQALTVLFQDDLRERRRREGEQDSEKLRDLLAPVSPDIVHRQACESWQHSGPSSWFVDDVVTKWLTRDDPGERVMVLTGKSGAGKTTLISQAIERCKQHTFTDYSTHVAYFYCSYSDTASQEVRNISGSWINQITAEQNSFLTRFKPLMKEGPEILSAAVERALQEVKGTVILFLDAVNESNEIEKIWRCISRLTTGTANIKCLASTTTAPQDFGLTYRRVDMRTELVTPDIETYIKTKRSKHHILRSVSEEEILQALLPRADGMFRWVDCQMTILSEQLTPKLVRKALQNLPGNINETYVAILSRIPPRDRGFVREALSWLSYSGRPLRLRELCEAVVLEESDSDIDDSSRLYPQHLLVELCRGLVVWDSLTDIISLAHSSIRAFLIGPEIRSTKCASFALDRQASLCNIVRKCLTYLMMQHFNLPYRALAELQKLQDSYPLLDYACKMWATQARIIQRHFGERELSLIDQFMNTQKSKTEASNFRFWINWLIAGSDARSDAQIVQSAEPLYYAASFGLDMYIERVFRRNLINKDDPNEPWYIDHKCGRNWSTALHVACVRGTTQTVEMLLREGADPNSTGFDGPSCLFWACRRRRPDIPRLLKAYGAIPSEMELPDMYQFTNWAEFFKPDFDQEEDAIPTKTA